MTQKETTILTIITVILVIALVYLLTVRFSDDQQVQVKDIEEEVSSEDVTLREVEPDDPDYAEEENILGDDWVDDPNEGLPLGAEGIASLPNVIFNVFGDVVEVGNDYVVISTSGQHMESKNPTQITVYVVEDKFESTAVDPEEQILISGTNILDRNNNEISLKDLSSNMIVSVESNENIKNETEFNASIIKIIE